MTPSEFAWSIAGPTPSDLARMVAASASAARASHDKIRTALAEVQGLSSPAVGSSDGTTVGTTLRYRDVAAAINDRAPTAARIIRS